MDFSSDAAAASSLEEMATAYIPAMVLFASVELGLIEALDEPRTVNELAERTQATVDGVTRLCRVLCHMGILTRDGDHLSAPPAVRRALVSQGLASVVRHHQRHVAPLLERLGEGVRTGRSQHAGWRFAASPPAAVPYAELVRHPEEYATFIDVMERSSRGVGEAIAQVVDLSSAKRLVDLGCGGGIVARELLRAVPGLHIESFDLPPACAIARQSSAREGLGARHSIKEGDLLEGVPSKDADAVLLSAILADWSPSERALILRHAYAALRPSGRILISETLLDDDRSGPMKPAMLSLFMLIGMRGDQLSAAEIFSELRAAGFVRPVLHRGSLRDLVVAERDT